jgi:hypothetical protein
LPRQATAGLHYVDYRSKRVDFEAQKNIFHVKKPQLRAISGIVQTPLKEGGCRDISNIFAHKLR